MPSPCSPAPAATCASYTPTVIGAGPLSQLVEVLTQLRGGDCHDPQHYVVTLRLGQPARIEAWDDIGLRQLQGLVGGLVDRVPLHRHIDLWIHDEGRLRAYPRWNVDIVDGYHLHQIAESAVLAAHDGQGRTLGFPLDMARSILRTASRWARPCLTEEPQPEPEHCLPGPAVAVPCYNCPTPSP